MNRSILRLAIPNIVTNITVPLLGMVDLAVVGRMGSAAYIGAIALGGVIFNFIYWGFGFLRMGTTGFTAQAYGARDFGESTAVLSRALIVSLAGAILVLILQKPIGELSFLLIRGGKEMEILAKEYFYIRIWAAPATISLYALTGWFLGMQNARIPMIIAVAVNITNIGFNLMLVYGFGMKSDGVALGTVLAQYLGLILAIFFLIRYYRKLFIYWKKDILKDMEAMFRFLNVNKDILLRTLALILVFSFFTAESAKFGDTLLAVNTLLLQFFMIFSYFTDGFAYAAESLAGKYTGARNEPMFIRTVKYLFYWGLGLSIPFSLIYLVSGNHLLYLLTDNQEVIGGTGPYMWYVVLIPLITFPAFLWDGIYIGATASRGMRNSMLIAVFVLFFPGYLILGKTAGNHALWISLLLFMTGRGLMQTLWAKKELLAVFRL